MLKPILLALCLLMTIGGIAVMKTRFALRAARTRSTSFIEAAAGTLWLRDERGRFRWYVPVWVVFWFAAFLVVGVFVK
jgi:predicted nucleic acid-binding protein